MLGLRMCAFRIDQNGSRTGKLDKYIVQKCDSLSACKGQHINTNSNKGECVIMLHDNMKPHTTWQTPKWFQQYG